VSVQEYLSSGQIEAYALGMASPEEARLAAQMCEQHSEVEAYFQEVAYQITFLGEAYAKPAPKRAKARLFETIAAENSNNTVIEPKVNSFRENDSRVNSEIPSLSQPETKVVNLMPWRMGIAASIAIAMVSLGGNMYFYNEMNFAKEALAEARRSNQTLASDIQRTALEKEKISTQLAMAADPFMPKVMLGGMNSAKEAKVLVVLDNKKSMAQIAMKNMPKVPSQMDLQLWAIVDGKPMDLGILPMREDGILDYKIPDITKATALAVTIETKGGHPQPQGEMILMGELKL